MRNQGILFSCSPEKLCFDNFANLWLKQLSFENLPSPFNEYFFGVRRGFIESFSFKEPKKLSSRHKCLPSAISGAALILDVISHKRWVLL